MKARHPYFSLLIPLTLVVPVRVVSFHVMQPPNFPPFVVASEGSTSLFTQLPPDIGAERENALYAMYQAGQFPGWLRRWVEVRVASARNMGSFFVLPDFLCVGTDTDYLYTPMGALNAERVLSLFDAALPTQKMVDDVYTSSRCQVAQPWGPPYDASMMRTQRWPIQTSKIRRQMGEHGAQPGDLVEGHCKNVIVSPRVMLANGVRLGYYGFFCTSGVPYQHDDLAHGVSYCDYSHGIRGVYNRVVVNGAWLALSDALQDTRYADLLSYSAFCPSTYKDARSLYAQQHGGVEPPAPA